jgi:radical SAM superfamily enzyme YgiQ (UPF0313 family)
LATLSCYLPEDIELEIIDERFQKIDFAKNYDLVGISMITPEAVRGYEIADKFRERKVKVVIGGVHGTAMPQEAIRHSDAVVIGEGEIIWPELINDFRAGKMKAYYKADTLIDLATLPPPRYDLLPKNPYSMVWIETSRGCPHDCEFCVVTEVHGRKIRTKTVEQIVNEAKSIKAHFGNIHIGFTDDNFLAEKSRKRTKAILRELIPLKIRWFGFTDISMAEDEEMLDLVKKSGCVALIVGFESVNQDCLSNIDKRNWKHSKYEKYPEYIDTIQSKGIGIIGSFILGLENEGDDIFEKTRDFIIDNYLYAFLVGVVTPFPGTRLRERFIKDNRLLDTGWDNYTKSGINIIPQNMSLKRFSEKIAGLLESLYTKEVVMRTLSHFKEIAFKNLKK